MSKVLLLSDLHAGVKSDSEIFLNQFSSLFENFIPEQIIKYKCETIFILGDLFDNRNNVNVKTLNVVYVAFKNFTTKFPNIKIYILLGNHDTYYKNRKDVNSLGLFNEFKNIEVISEITNLTLFNRGIVLCPWLTDSEETSHLFEKKQDICMGHFEINGFEMVSGIKENNGIPPTKFIENFKLTFSGHFHLRDEENEIIYVGNPYQTKWSDYGNSKGIYILDLGTLKYDFVENTEAPQFKKIYLSQMKKKLIDVKKEVPNNFISLILDDEIENKLLDRINYLISSLQPLSFNIIDSEKAYGDITLDDLSSSPIEFLSDYIKGKNFNENIDKEFLFRKLNSLYNLVNPV